MESVFENKIKEATAQRGVSVSFNSFPFTFPLPFGRSRLSILTLQAVVYHFAGSCILLQIVLTKETQLSNMGKQRWENILHYILFKHIPLTHQCIIRHWNTKLNWAAVG